MNRLPWRLEALNGTTGLSYDANGNLLSVTDPRSNATPYTYVTMDGLAARKRFFHWEIEFPDVFCAPGSGFDAILGNPPWDIAKPNSKEFFSNIDPLYRAYGKQEALRYQTEYFADEEIERSWLDYNADFRAQSNAMGYFASPFGDPSENEKSQDRLTIVRGGENDRLHTRCRTARAKSRGFADPAHSFRHQGSADLNLDKAFLEQAHALLRVGGRFGFIVPSGLYSDHGTGGLRKLFLDRCRWEWLFGFENRDGIFEIHRSFKFNPVIIEKGGKTESIRTAFMRSKLEDWERAEALVTHYSRAQVERFSPWSKAILEIQSPRDLEILEKTYSNSVLLGDDRAGGWGIRYAQGDFNMTSDSKLFPLRTKWEADGYRPDEYSRWIKGDWRPISELWTELGVKPLPEGERRCTQPPYDSLPIPRADFPQGVVLSREADACVRQERVEAVALPLYQGVMIHQFDHAWKQWIGGSGSKAWELTRGDTKCLTSKFLLAESIYRASEKGLKGFKLGFRDIARTTDERTMIACLVPDRPCGNKVPLLQPASSAWLPMLSATLNSWVFDWAHRARQGGTSINYFIIDEGPLVKPPSSSGAAIATVPIRLGLSALIFSAQWLGFSASFLPIAWRRLWAVSRSERLRLRCIQDSVVAVQYGLADDDLRHVLRNCDHSEAGGDPTGFWRVDKDKDPELRHTVLTLVAFHDLEEKIRACGGDREKGIEAFLNQNDGDGWILPETLRLADYGLGHDERAKQPQPVASHLGPRFYDWQLAQSAEESWRECHLHARNLLGEEGYKQLLADIEAERRGEKPSRVAEEPATPYGQRDKQGKLFE